jgi:hypothetical protein
MFNDMHLEELFYKKKELINSFDEILTPSEIEKLRNIPSLAIGEIAGRDSVAAIIDAAKRDDIGSILPVAIYTGTLYGDWKTILETVAYIQDEVKRRYNKKVHRLAVLGSPLLWHALNGRFMQVLFEKFGFFSPCLGCHLYFHSIVIPLAKKLNCTAVIAGERESHDGKIKLNQTAIAIDAYVSMLEDFGLQLILPLRHVQDKAEVDSIIGEKWRDDDQMACVLSGNYKYLDGKSNYNEATSREFYDRYALPAMKSIIEGILEGRKLNYQDEVNKILEMN